MPDLGKTALQSAAEDFMFSTLSLFLTCSVFNLEKQKMEGDLQKFCFLGRMPRALLLLVHESHLKWPNCSVV